MKKTAILILLFALTASVVRAQYASVNVDYKTMAAMSEAFTTEASMEALHNDNLQKIYNSYKAAEVASAGIFASKYLDRKALTNLNLWDDQRENYYYTRIYNIVAKRIIPKTITCAKLMIEDPATAIYWGSYLVKTTTDVKSLCQQFESVVTNSRLSFKDIAFPMIVDELKDVFSITNLGSIDWKNVFEHIGDDIEGAFTKENFEKDLDNLISKGVGLANAGYQSGIDRLMHGTSFEGTFQNKILSVLTLVNNASGMYNEFKDLSAQQVLTRLVGQDNINNLFDLGEYNLTRWIDDYSKASQGQYYTQRVYIYRQESGAENLCDYMPPSGDNSIMYGDHWYRIETTDPDFTPNSSQTEAILQNSENHAGWSRSRVNQLNQTVKDGHTYTIDYYRKSNTLSMNGNQYAKTYAYSIEVTHSWNIKEEVYEEVFDSYSMDWNAFMAQMNARCQQYNANGDHAEINSVQDLEDYINSHTSETNYTYYVGYDTKHYYSATDARKIQGSTSATFSITCHGGGTLGKGSTTYKCSKCGKTIGDHAKECSMYTTLTDMGDIDTSELTQRLTELRTRASSLQKQIDELNQRSSELLRLMSTATHTDEYESYRAEYESNKARVESFTAELKSVNENIAAVQNAIEEAKQGEQEQTDDYERIPQIMKSMADAYSIKWTDNGSWSGYTFIRRGNVGSVNGTVIFKARVSIARPAKYFIGIKIHRAILQIDWELISEWTDTSIVETMELGPSKSDEENASLVNQRISELAQDYPNCDISVEYSRSKAVETEDTEATYHLLWASDRLEIARGIEARLAKIYTDLVMIEKFLHYKHGIKDWLKDLIPNLNADKGRKLTIADRCRRRWLHNGGSKNYEWENEDDEYEQYQP